MNKTVIMSTVALVIVVIGLVNYFYLTPKAAKLEQMENDMEQYLYLDRGYLEEEILEVDVRFDPWKQTGLQRYTAVVYFADEPENDYGYSYSQDGEIEPSYFGNGRHNP
ncbi:DUF3139 domain-containing protein [Planococcus sp. NCCP-2050]|uniref:DUF3139 domain-containing protein n=1 Tax=Planococcus sp. NCCP-2050 TaxID=2944679 RepID=UPI00203E631C|nr:DUF3139 domain-containing protein [Planococcus sp. NCCP-2050]GKW46920.1 hypothetical protein NCCP2050_26120 [Planococcus sp. NCCP-2050]